MKIGLERTVRARASMGVVGAAAWVIGMSSATADPLGVPLWAQGDDNADAIMNEVLEPLVEDALGLVDGRVLTLEVPDSAATPFDLTLPVDGRALTIRLAPHSNRAESYRILVDPGGGALFEHPPGPVRTMRGNVVGDPGVRAAASLLDNGLHLQLQFEDGASWWLEPIDRAIPGTSGRYVLYESTDVIAHGGTCGLADAALPDRNVFAERADAGFGLPDSVPGGPLAAGGNCVAELACDADTEYFNDYGSVAAVEARINSVINQVNLQYEAQVQITHPITTIIVRTGTDPYTSTDAETRLCQFITEWTNNQTSIQRDLAQLFTGVEIASTTIGIAADIGGSGVCVTQGACTGGPFGPLGSYCLSQSDFNGNFSCAMDLSAHEMGHLWGAFHCSCPSNTMNSGITCTNNFSAGSINSISNYRDTRTCLDGSCAGGPTPPANDSCSSPTVIPCNTNETFTNLNATPTPGIDDGELPAGSPSCQWQSNPNAVHNTVWFEFTADDTSVEIETCATTAIQDTILALYDGSCGSLIELACSEDACGASTYMSSICYNGLTPGNTYRIMVGNPGGWTGSTPGTIVMDVACPCPAIGPVAGACCLSGGSCIGPVTAAQCAAQSGTFQGSGTDCGGVTCGPLSGACCFSDGSCNELTSGNCASVGGTYQGDGSSCSPNPCPQPTGACCLGATCVIDTAAGCSGASGIYQGDGTSCSPDPCALPTGACCFGDGSCTVLASADCGTSGGGYEGDGTSCSPNPCPQPTGACCLPGGACIVDTVMACNAGSGSYQGDGTTCVDSDSDGVADLCDGCPSDPNKTSPGICGCGTPDTDTDNDGTPDCNDGCPNDPNKTDPGLCGCGTPDTDTDNDGTPDCNDGCPNDPDKTNPGTCGCGTPDTDSDGDGVPDCDDNCVSIGNPGQADCDNDGIGDACAGEPDCNTNGVPDSCDISSGTSDDLDGNGVPDECEGGGATAQLEGNAVLVGATPVTVSLLNAYQSPVVVCTIRYSANTTPVVARVSNVSSSSFDVRLVNPSGGAVAAETVSYLVMEEGVWTIDGVACEAQRYVSTVTDENNSWVGQTQSYGQSYTSPVVIGQVMTENDPDWSVFWSRGTSRTNPPSATSLFTGKTVCEDSDVTRVDETVGFIVLESGHGSIGGVEFEALLGADSVLGVGDSPPYSYTFSTPFASAPTVAVMSMSGMDGGNGGWAQSHGPSVATTTTLFVSVDEDQIQDTERVHISEQFSYVAFTGAVRYPDVGGPTAQLESGALTVGGTPVTVNLANTYQSAVVVCTVNYSNNTIPIVARVSNVTSSSFDVRIVNPSGAGVSPESVSYLVMEEGTWTIDGVACEAQQYTSTVTDENNSWIGQAQSYGQSYANPVVIGQVMTENDPDWSNFWCRGSGVTSPPSSTSLFTGKMVAEDTDVTRADETVGFIVFESGHGTLGGVEFEALLSADVVRGPSNGPPFSVTFGTAFASPPTVGLMSLAGMDGNNGGWALSFGSPIASSTAMFAVIDEDQIGDSERSHTTEQVGAVAFGGPTVIGSGARVTGSGVAGLPAPSPDVNQDGVIDGVDVLALVGAWGECGGCPADLDRDGAVGSLDLAILVNAGR